MAKPLIPAPAIRIFVRAIGFVVLVFQLLEFGFAKIERCCGFFLLRLVREVEVDGGGKTVGKEG